MKPDQDADFLEKWHSEFRSVSIPVLRPDIFCHAGRLINGGNVDSIDQKTVTAYLHEMAEHKVIEIEKIPAADAYDKQLHNVYVIGRHDFSKMENYLVDDLATSDS